jgi:hypothetical protein
MNRRRAWRLLPSLLLLLTACGRAPEPLTATPVVAAPAVDPLVGKVWLRSDVGAPPGELRIFLPDGSLLMSSCVETYRIVRWQRIAPDTIRWDEDGVSVEAGLNALGAAELQLELRLRGGERQLQHYQALNAARVCPDLPR